MALQTIPGQSLYYPRVPPFSGAAMTFLSSVIDATGEKFAWVGRFWHKSRGSMDVRNVGFLFGTVTKSGGSALTVSLQDVSLTANPTQPDETQDQTVAIANADASFATNTWIETGNLSADRTLAYGELVAVVLEYDGSGRLGSDSVAVRNLSNNIFGGAPWHLPQAAHKAGSWSFTTGCPNIVLKCTDGTYGTLAGAFPISSVTQNAFHQGTAGADEYALEFSVPFPCKVDGFWIHASVGAATADFDVVLYDGTSAMTGGTVSHDANNIATSSAECLIEAPFTQEISLSANTTYRLAVKPTQATSGYTMTSFNVATANHFQAHDVGTSGVLTTRLNLGAWAAATTTRRPVMGVRISAFDDGVGGGGGMLVNPGMSGRLV